MSAETWNCITIPFRTQFREALLLEQKSLTARTKRFGSAGDRFQVFGATFELLTVTQVPLSHVAAHWHEEGCRSEADFIDIWVSLHPKKGYDPLQVVWLHRFMKLRTMTRNDL